MEWLLIVLTMGYHGPQSFGDSGYAKEGFCKKAGADVVKRLNDREMAEQQRKTVVNVTGGTSEGYSAKVWAFECVQVRKR
jgi:hypothetical protein